ncbi:MAG: hypothetical protein GY841_08740 [FCB group bacterium]|nr:hypothetical protein [FCB group bacterium]
MNKTLLLSLLTITVIIVGWYALLGKPQAARIKATGDSLAAVDNKLKAYKSALSEFVVRQREYDTLHNAILEFGTPFSGTDEVIALYKLLDSLSTQDGFILEEIAPSLEEIITFFREWESAKEMASIPIRINIRGRYKNLADFVQTIEQSVYFDQLTSCRVIGSDELYPDCKLELAFIAGLYNRKGIIDFE